MPLRRPWAASLLAVATAAAPACNLQREAPGTAPAGPKASLERLRSLDYAAPAAQEATRKAAASVTGDTGAVPALQAMAAARKLIRTAHLQMEVARYEDAARAAERIALEQGGYLADTEASRGDQDRRQGSLSLRVPADRFSAALAALKELGQVQSETVKTDDVTKAYADLETRLRVKRDTADRLRDILRTRTAGLTELLEAERELARITEQIEQMEGERRFYDQQAALSTLNLALFEPQALVKPGVFAPVTAALHDSLSLLAASVSALIYVTVLLAPWALVAYVVYRIVRARLARRRRPAPLDPAAPAAGA